jgi:hypothetical protein
MPKYFYKCVDETCSRVFEIVHSMSEKLISCSQCTKDCERDIAIERMPPISIQIIKERETINQGKKPGELVKKNIEEFRKALKEEQKKLSDVEYK